MDSNQCEDYISAVASDCSKLKTEDDCRAFFDYFVAEGCKFGGSDQYAIFRQRACQECIKKTEADSGNGNGGIDFEAAWDFLLAPITDLVNSIMDDIFKTLESIVDTIGGWLDNLIKNITGVFTAIYDVIRDMLGSVKDWFAGVWEEVKEIWRKVSAWIVGVYEAVEDFIVGVYQNVKTWLGDIYDRVKEAVIAIYEWAVDTFNKVVEWVGERLQEVWEGIKAVYYAIGDFLKAAYEATLKPIFEWFVRLYEDFTDAINKIGEWFADIDREVKDFVNGLNEAMLTGIEDFIGELGNILFGVFEKVGASLMNLPDDIDVVLYDVLSNVVAKMLGISERLAKEVLQKGTVQPTEG